MNDVTTRTHPKESEMNDTTTTTIELPVRGNGEALENHPTSRFGLVGVQASTGEVTWVPDPDNDQKTIFWVRDATGPTVTLTLSYAGL